MCFPISLHDQLSSEGHYRDILATLTPTVRIGDPYVLYRTANLLVQETFNNFSDVIEKLADDDEISIAEARSVLGSFLALGLSYRDTSIKVFDDQPARLTPKFSDGDQLRIAYLDRVCAALEELLGSVEVAIVENLVYGQQSIEPDSGTN